MSLDAPSPTRFDGSRHRFGIVAARFNQTLVDGLLARVQAELRAAGVPAEQQVVVRVPGSHEVPYAVSALSRTGSFDCLIALGVLIAGDTNHHEMVGNSVSFALQQISISTERPVINGVIVVNSLAQAEARTIGSIDRGAEFAHAALEMAALKTSFSR